MFENLINFAKTSSLPTRFDLMDDLQNLDLKGKHACTLINLQINDFDDITNYFGLSVASEIREQVSLFLEKNLPTRSSKLYQFEMDKFMIFISGRISLIQINKYTKDLLNLINKETFFSQGQIYSISATIGVARGRKSLFKRSYLALNEARKKESSYVIFNHKTNIEEKFLKNINMHNTIKEAIENDKIIALYQPIYNIKTKKIEKHEALIRLENEDGSLKQPIEFLEIAKKVKLYTKLTKKMVKLAVLKAATTKNYVTININMHDIENPSISRFIYNFIEKSAIGKYITFEIVESEKITSYTKVSNFIKKLKNLGCKFAIDDFGSGYSNFEHILKLDFDYIKIDGSLIKNIDNSTENEVFVKSIITLAKELNIKTIAEYVYNKSVYEKITSLGIDYAQGYYIGKARNLIA